MFCMLEGDICLCCAVASGSVSAIICCILYDPDSGCWLPVPPKTPASQSFIVHKVLCMQTFYIELKYIETGFK